MLEHFRSHAARPAARLFVSTPNVLTLAPEGRREVGQPVARPRVPRRGVPRAVRRALRARSSCYGLFHARKLRAHELAIRARLGRRAPARWASRSASTTASRRRSRASDFRLRAGEPATLERRARLRRRLPAVSARPAGRARARPAHAHALRRGLRDVAVRRGVAVGGDRDVLPAAARRARARRAADAVADAGALRPARGAGRRRALPAPSCATCAARRTARHRRLPRRRAPTSSRPSSSARPRDYGAAPRALRGARRRPARRARAARRLDLVGDPRRAAAAGDRRRRAAAGRGRASTRTGARFGDAWRGGFWLPECAHAPWLDPLLEEAGVHATCVDLTDVLRRRARPSTCAPLRAEAGPLLVPIDRAIDRARVERRRLPVPRRLPRLPPPHDARPPPWAHDGSRLRPRGAPRRWPAARGRLRRAGGAERVRRRRACACARSTPSCSATGGTRGRQWLRGGRRTRPPRRACRSSHLDDALARPSSPPAARAAPSCRSRPGARRATCSTWDGPTVADLAWRARATPSCASVAAGRARRRARACASCWRCSPATGRSSSQRRPRRRLRARARRRPRCGRWTRRFDSVGSAPAVRNLAPYVTRRPAARAHDARASSSSPGSTRRSSRAGSRATCASSPRSSSAPGVEVHVLTRGDETHAVRGGRRRRPRPPRARAAPARATSASSSPGSST